MLGLDDYYAYTSNSSTGGRNHRGLLSAVFWISLILLFLWVIWKFS